MGLYRMLSSAKSLILDWTQSGRSFIKTKKSSGPKTVLWVTRLRTSTLSDVAPSTVTYCVLCVRKALIQSKVFPLTP